LHKHLVDTNMLLRSLILSSHLFDSCTSESPYFSKKISQSKQFYERVFPNDKSRIRAMGVCLPTKDYILCPKTDYKTANIIKSDLSEFRQFSTKFDFLCELGSCMHAKQLSQENISCLNTGIAILIIAYKQEELTKFLKAIAERDNKQEPNDWSFAVRYLLSDRRDTEVDKDTYTFYPNEPVPLVLNMIQLLTFWKRHYFLKIKQIDCVTLVQCTAFSMMEWVTVIQICLDELWELAESTPSINKCLVKLPKHWYDVHREPCLNRQRKQFREQLLENPECSWRDVEERNALSDDSSCSSEASLSSVTDTSDTDEYFTIEESEELVGELSDESPKKIFASNQ